MDGTFCCRGIVRLGLEEFLHLIVNVLGSEAEFLVEHLVGGGETKAGETPDVSVGTDKSFEGDGKTSGETELLDACGQDTLLVVLRLATEEAFGGDADDAHLQTVGTEQGSTADKRADFGAAGKEDDIGVAMGIRLNPIICSSLFLI